MFGLALSRIMCSTIFLQSVLDQLYTTALHSPGHEVTVCRIYNTHCKYDNFSVNFCATILQFWSDLVMQHLETTHLFFIRPPECAPLLDSSTPRVERIIFFPVPHHLRSTQTQGTLESVFNMHTLQKEGQSWERELTSVQILRRLLMQPKAAPNRSYGEAEAPGLMLSQTSWWFRAWKL